MDYALILGVLAVVVLIFIMLKQRGKEKASVKNNQSSTRRVSNNNDAEEQADSDVWVSQVNTSVSDTEQSWEWDTNNADLSTASVSAQEVDPLTEYQVYKQFGYEDKAAASLASYLNNLKSDAPEKLVSELAGLCLNIGDVDLLSSTLERHASVLPQTALAEYIKAGLGLDSNHLGLRVLAESKLNWGMQEVARQIGEQTGLDVSDSDSSSYNVSSTVEVTINNDGREVKRLTKRSPLIIGKAEVGDMTEEEMSAVIGFVKPEKSAKLIKNQVDYETALQQYNKAIQKAIESRRIDADFKFYLKGLKIKD